MVNSTNLKKSLLDAEQRINSKHSLIQVINFLNTICSSNQLLINSCLGNAYNYLRVLFSYIRKVSQGIGRMSKTRRVSVVDGLSRKSHGLASSCVSKILCKHLQSRFMILKWKKRELLNKKLTWEQLIYHFLQTLSKSNGKPVEKRVNLHVMFTDKPNWKRKPTGLRCASKRITGNVMNCLHIRKKSINNRKSLSLLINTAVMAGQWLVAMIMKTSTNSEEATIAQKETEK